MLTIRIPRHNINPEIPGAVGMATAEPLLVEGDKETGVCP